MATPEFDPLVSSGSLHSGTWDTTEPLFPLDPEGFGTVVGPTLPVYGFSSEFATVTELPCPVRLFDNHRKTDAIAETKRDKSNRHVAKYRNGAPEEIRTPDPQIRSLVLYPAELRAPCLLGLNAAGRTAHCYRLPVSLARAVRL